MTRPTRPTPQHSVPTPRRRPHETGGAHDYGGNPDLAGEANEPGDRVQGSDGRPVTGKP
jgi:hypothetical protein